MEWINQYLASRYEDGARGPDKYDCWGLVRDARHKHLGKALLPSWGSVRNTSPRDFTRAYLEGAETMEECAPEQGAIAAVMHGRICTHVALVVGVSGRLFILETNRVRGPRWLPLYRFARDHLRVIYHRDKP